MTKWSENPSESGTFCCNDLYMEGRFSRHCWSLFDPRLDRRIDGLKHEWGNG